MGHVPTPGLDPVAGEPYRWNRRNRRKRGHGTRLAHKSRKASKKYATTFQQPRPHSHTDGLGGHCQICWALVASLDFHAVRLRGTDYPSCAGLRTKSCPIGQLARLPNTGTRRLRRGYRVRMPLLRQSFATNYRYATRAAEPSACAPSYLIAVFRTMGGVLGRYRLFHTALGGQFVRRFVVSHDPLTAVRERVSEMIPTQSNESQSNEHWISRRWPRPTPPRGQLYLLSAQWAQRATSQSLQG